MSMRTINKNIEDSTICLAGLKSTLNNYNRTDFLLGCENWNRYDCKAFILKLDKVLNFEK